MSPFARPAEPRVPLARLAHLEIIGPRRDSGGSFSRILLRRPGRLAWVLGVAREGVVDVPASALLELAPRPGEGA